MSNSRPVIFVVALSLMEHGLSGGDVRLRAMLQRWQHEADITVFTSPAGKRNMENWGINVTFVTSLPFCEKMRQKSDVFAQISNYWSLLTIKISKIVADLLPDVIYVQTDFPFEVKLGVRLKKRFKNARLFALSHHSYREIYGLSGKLHHLILKNMQEYSYRLLAKYADLVTVLPTVTGDFCKDDLLKAGVDEGKVDRMWNGVDIDVINDIEDVDKEYDACIIGLRKNKGLYDVSSIWQRICEKRSSSTLYIIGNIADMDEKWLLAELKKHGLEDSVIFGGHFSPPDLYREIKKAKLCIAPTHQEPYGIAICEAMACGLPVVGYDLANYRRLHENIVMTVPCYDFDAFADAAVLLLQNMDKLNEMSIQGKSHMLDFSNDKIAEVDFKQLVAGEKDNESFKK